MDYNKIPTLAEGIDEFTHSLIFKEKREAMILFMENTELSEVAKETFEKFSKQKKGEMLFI